MPPKEVSRGFGAKGDFHENEQTVDRRVSAGGGARLFNCRRSRRRLELHFQEVLVLECNIHIYIYPVASLQGLKSAVVLPSRSTPVP
eukprot:COSAG02_NODE_36493_length_453_cov_276.042373_1_plen_86_part_10